MTTPEPGVATVALTISGAGGCATSYAWHLTEDQARALDLHLWREYGEASVKIFTPAEEVAAHAHAPATPCASCEAHA